MDELLEYRDSGSKYQFYGTTVQELEDLMTGAGTEPICNVAADGIAYMLNTKINSAEDTDFEKWLSYHYSTCEDKSILGYSLHGLYFGRKK